MKRIILINFVILISMISPIIIFANEIDNIDVPLPFNLEISVVSNEKVSTILVEGKGKINAVTLLYKYKFKAWNGKIIDYYCQDILCYTNGTIDYVATDFGAVLHIEEYKGYQCSYGLMYSGGLFDENEIVNSTTANYIIELGENSVDPQTYFYTKSQSIVEQLIDGSPISNISGVDRVYNGNLIDFDVNGNLIPKDKVYDLEIPLNVKCNNKPIVDIGPIEFGTSKYTTITWEQSETTNVQGWLTEIYYMQKGSYGKNIWNVVNKPKFETPWFFYDEVWNYLNKFKVNTLNFKDTDNYLKDLVGIEPQIVNVSRTNYMIRNKFVDETNGVTHYSNYVYIQEDSDGNYIASEVNGKDLDNVVGDKSIFTTDEIEGNVDTNSDNYVGTNISNTSTTDIDFKGGISVLKSLFSDIKQFPSFLADMFQFLPNELVYCLTGLLLILIPLCVIKLVL